MGRSACTLTHGILRGGTSDAVTFEAEKNHLLASYNNQKATDFRSLDKIGFPYIPPLLWAGEQLLIMMRIEVTLASAGYPKGNGARLGGELVHIRSNQLNGWLISRSPKPAVYIFRSIAFTTSHSPVEAITPSDSSLPAGIRIVMALLYFRLVRSIS